MGPNNDDVMYKLKDLERDLADLDGRIEEAESEIHAAKEKKKKLDEEYNAKVTILRKVIRNEETDGGPTLWDGVGEQPQNTIANEVPKGNEWRSVTLDDLGLNVGKMGLVLKENNLSTLGDITTYKSDGKKFTDLAGIGEGKADQINNAVTAYWAKNPPTSETAEFARTFFKATTPEDGQPNAGAPEGEAPVDGVQQDGLNVISAADMGSEFIVAAQDNWNDCKNIYAQALGGSKPKVGVLMLQDEANRFHAGAYVIVGFKEQKYKLVRAYGKDEWMKVLGESNNTTGGDPVGDLSGCVVTDNDAPTTELWLGGDADSFYVDATVKEEAPVDSTTAAPVENTEAPATNAEEPAVETKTEADAVVTQ